MDIPDGPSTPASDDEALWKLARRIEEKQLWAAYLSEQEHALWREALRRRDTWDAFLKGRGEAMDPARGHDGAGEHVNGTTKAEDNGEKVADPVTTAFRARAMLFEASIRKLYPSQSNDESLDFDMSDVSDDRESQAQLVIEEKPNIRKIEDDNYDDLEEQDSMTLVQPSGPSSQNDENSMNNLDESSILPQIKSFPIDTYYHTFEHDRVAMLELQTVEELNRQNNTEATASGTQNSLSTVNFGAANLSLKHLLSKIDSKRDTLSVTDAELRKLFSDVRKNRSNSKWASDEFIGREELYEALEHMLKKIMADKNAYPFLAKVRRMVAPDYYNIIRRPMDLGTVQRNLKTGTYFKSKAQFLAEVNLIWDNCLTYNTDPNHSLRPLAYAMRNTTAALADLVPDITIRTRAEVEAEEAAEAEDDAHSEDEKPVKSSRKAGGFSSKGVSQKGGPSKMRGPLHEDALENRLLNGVREGSIGGSQDGRSSSQVNGMYTTPPPGGTPMGDMEGQLDPAQVAEQAREEGGNDSDEGDVLSREWSSQTQQARAKYALRRHKLLRKGLTEDEPALIRTKKGMSKFKDWNERVDDVVRFQEPEQEPDPENEDVLADEGNQEEDQFLAEYDVASGTLNGLTPLTLLDEETIKELYAKPTSRPELSFIDPRLRPPTGGLLKIMRENARKLGEIRKICNKVAIIRNIGQQPPGVYQPPPPSAKPLEVDDYVWGCEVEGEDQFSDAPSDVMTPELGRYAMEQAIAKLLFHSGFEDFQASAFDIITGVATEYLLDIGRTLRLYLNNNDARKKYSEEELLLHALDLNGVEDLEKLDIYIKDDIERYGTKLEDCHRRLKRFLAELLRPAIQEGEDGANMFDDQSESFVSGDFTDELGEDFFGFKELGLDKEFGMISLSVPLRLLQGRMRAVINPVGEGNQDAVQTELVEPPPWELVTAESLEFEIGLIQTFFREKLAHSEQTHIIEDENLPMKQRPVKPRLPPTGKINTPRKRKDPPVAGGSAKKKKKTGKPPVVEPPPQLPTPPMMASIREEEGSDIESLFG